jgi:CheY-like chemotaxis protein
MTKILLVEDNEANRDMLTRRLIKRGYEVVPAIDATEGFASIAAGKPDVILMDVDLPGIDGWEATRRLKADPETKAIPVIVLTAHAMNEHREKSLAVGGDDYDTKPIDLARLLGKIEALVSRRSDT